MTLKQQIFVKSSLKKNKTEYLKGDGKMKNLENSVSLAISDRTDEKETSIEFSGTFAVLGIALIAFGLGYTCASSKKKAL